MTKRTTSPADLAALVAALRTGAATAAMQHQAADLLARYGPAPKESRKPGRPRKTKRDLDLVLAVLAERGAHQEFPDEYATGEKAYKRVSDDLHMKPQTVRRTYMRQKQPKK